VVARPVVVPKEDYMSGRNPRLFQFRLQQSENISAFEILAWEKYSIDRTLLRGSEPDKETVLDDTTKRLLSGWLGRRYYRPAFPDAFQTRQSLHQSKKRPADALKSLVKCYPEHILGLYLKVNPLTELEDPNTAYEVEVLCVATPEGFETNAEKLTSIFGNYVSGLRQCSGVNVVDDLFVSACDIPLWNVQGFHRLTEYDYLSPSDEIDN
jgi:hypothetical protein